MSDFSFIANAHPSYIESMYEKYQQDPGLVEASWRAFFKGFDFAHSTNGHSGNGATATVSTDLQREFKALALIKAFRNRGHLLSTTNPIRQRRDRRPNLNLDDFGLSDADLSLDEEEGAKKPAAEGEEGEEGEDLLEETPDFLQESEGEDLWFEQGPPRDFDFDDD